MKNLRLMRSKLLPLFLLCLILSSCGWFHNLMMPKPELGMTLQDLKKCFVHPPDYIGAGYGGGRRMIVSFGVEHFEFENGVLVQIGF